MDNSSLQKEVFMGDKNSSSFKAEVSKKVKKAFNVSKKHKNARPDHYNFG